MKLYSGFSMKRLATLLTLLLVVSAPVALAQVAFTVVIRNPTPAELSTWQRDRSIVTVTITNSGQTAYPDVRVSFEVRNSDNGRTVVRSKDNDPSMPHFALAPFSSLVRSGGDLVNSNALDIDAALRTTSLTTNRLPEANYEFCARLVDPAGNELGSTGEICRPFTITIPDPPSLVAPDNGSPLPATGMPTFRWTAVPGTPGGQPIVYRLKLVPVFTGQTPRDAIERNTPLLNRTMLFASYTYMPSDPPFTSQPSATGFAWQVEAITSTGEPAARNEGKSEIFTLARTEDLRVLLNYPAGGEKYPDQEPPFIVDVAGDRSGTRTVRLTIQELDPSSRTVLREAGDFSGTVSLPLSGPFLLLNGQGTGMGTPLLGSSRWSAVPGKLYLWTVAMSLPSGGTSRNSSTFSTSPVATMLDPASGREVATASSHFSFRYTRPSLSGAFLPGFVPGAAFPLDARLTVTDNDLSPRVVFRDSVRLNYTTSQELDNTVAMPTLSDGTYHWYVETAYRGQTIAMSERADFSVRGSISCSDPGVCIEPVFPGQNSTPPVASSDLSFSLKFRPRINPDALTGGVIRVWYRLPSPDGSLGTEGDRTTTSRPPDFVLNFTGADLTDAGSTELFGIYNVTPRTSGGAGLRLRDATHYLWNVAVDYDSLRIRHDGAISPVRHSEKGPFFFSTLPPEAASAGSCTDDCSSPAPTNTTPSTGSFAVNDTLRVGKFRMALTRVSGTGASLTGEGTIRVPFLRAPILVEFTGIQVNADRQAFGGRVTAKQATGSPLSSSLANQGGTALGLTNQQIQNIQNYASDPLRLVSALVTSDPVGLPLGFDRVIDGRRLVIGVIGMAFTPTNATLNAVASYDMPSLGPGIGIGLGARDICFHPNGIGGDGRGRLYLPVDIGVNNDTTRIGFMIKAATPTDSGTYLSWDCHGWKELRIRAEAEFPRAWLIPSPDNGRRAKATFTLTARNDSGWIAIADMDRTSLTATPGFEMEVQDMAVDMSDLLNPPGIEFPRGFTGERSNAWTGFFIRRAAITLPEGMRRSDGRPISFSLSNVLIGNGGITFSARAENLVGGFAADLGGMGATIDTVGIDVVSSSLHQGWITGLFKLPFSDSSLTYRAMMGVDTAGADFKMNFSVFATDTINFSLDPNMSLYLSPTSRFDLSWIPRRGADGLSMTVRLGGTFCWAGTSGGIPGINFRGIGFEDFMYEKQGSVTNLTPPRFHFASGQHSTAGFPVSITAFTMVTGARPRGPGLGLQIGLALNVQSGSNGISGGTLLSAWGVFNTTDGKLEFDGVDLDSVGLSADLGAVRIRGGLRLYRTDPVFGDGFRGDLSATFLNQVTLEATMQAGTVHDMRYWYVDAKAALATGIPIFTGVGFYGLGGGAWYHMRREGTDPQITMSTTSSSSGTVGATRSGYRFVPDPATEFGFKAMVILGTHPRPDGFNADVGFEMSFLPGGGIGMIAITGQGYMMAGITDRSHAKVTADVRMEYNFPVNTFHGTFTIAVNASPFTGGGQMVMHADSAVWYVKVGEPEPRSSRVHLSMSTWLTIDAYLMAGLHLPGPPPLPDYVLRELPSYHQYRNPELSTGDGFAFGASARFETGRQTFLIFYGQASAEVGFDFSLLNYGTGTTCSGTGGTIGVNGWYAQGQMYAYLNAAVGLHVDVWFTEGDFEVLSVAAAAALEAGAPNPTWVRGAVGGRYSLLGGAVSGRCDFQFAVGEACRPVSESPLARLDLVSDIQPVTGSRDVDVFVEPQAAFNFTINQPFDLVESDTSGAGNVRTFRVKVRDFSLTKTDNQENVPGRWALSTDSVQATFTATNMLASHTRYTAQVAASGEEYKAGAWRQAQRRDGTSIDEVVSSTFTTGTAPDTVPANRVAYSYPLDRQRFFLQGECRDGRVALKAGMLPIFEARSGYSATLTARFIPTFGGQDVESPATYDASARQVRFAVPTLASNTVYALQIVKKEERLSAPGGIARTGVADRVAGALVRASARQRSLLAGQPDAATLREYKLAGTQSRDGEKLLYVYWFKTSQFSLLSEKVGALTAGATDVSPALLNVQLLTARFTGPEFFDVYDIEGYQYAPGQKIGPLAVLSASTRTDRWHTQFTNPWVYDAIQRLRTMGQWPYPVEFQRYTRFGTGLRLAEFVTGAQPLLSDAERGPAPPSPLRVREGVTRTSRMSQTVTGTRGMAAANTSLSIPSVRIQYSQTVPISIDFAHVRSRAAATLAAFGGEILSPGEEQWLRGLVNKRFELPCRGAYTIGFHYGYQGCQDPETVPVTLKRFTY